MENKTRLKSKQQQASRARMDASDMVVRANRWSREPGRGCGAGTCVRVTSEWRGQGQAMRSLPLLPRVAPSYRVVASASWCFCLSSC